MRYESRETPDGSRSWRVMMPLLSEGLVNWPQAIALFKAAGYDGPLSLHGEYSASEETHAVLELAAQDMAYLRQHV
jgi:sugar phosphate isomerase/epimerase